MIFLRLPCAGKLNNIYIKGMVGSCPKNLHRFHFTCLYCRMRRKHYGKWTDPPFWIDYTIPWLCEYLAAINKRTHEIVMFKHPQKWKTLKIDPRGHFTMLRCSAIIALLKIARWFPELVGDRDGRHVRMRPVWITVCELLANLTI